MSNRFGAERSSLIPAILAAFCLFLFACSDSSKADNQGTIVGEPMRLEVHAQPLAVVSANGKELAQFKIEIADTAGNRSDGLMFRTDLPKDGAMLFVFEDEDLRYFWMKNTPAPLDIIYADSSGEIVSIAKSTTPFSTAAIPSDAPARYALEVHAGVTDTMNIRAGDRLVHPQIATD